MTNADLGQAIIEDPKPRGYNNACSRDKHGLTAERIIAQHFTTKQGERTLHYIQGVFYSWNGLGYDEHGPEWGKLMLATKLRDAVVPKPRTYADAEGQQHSCFQLVPYDPTNELISNVLTHLKAQTLMPDNVFAPCWLPGAGKNMPPADELAPMANGLLHMATGKLLPPTPMFFCTRSSDVVYDPSVTACPNWTAYMEWMFGDDREAWEAQEEMMAYCLTGSNSFQRAFFLSSPGRGGKGTRMDVLEALAGIGSMAGCLISDFHPMKDTNLHKAIGAAVLWFDEPTFGGGVDRTSAAGRIKAISGGSRISISRKFFRQWSGVLTGKVVMTGNEMPDFHDASDVITERFIVIRTDASAEGAQDPNLFRDKLKPELTAILNTVVAAYARLMRRGKFVQPESGQYIKDNMSEGAAPVRDFLLDGKYWERGAAYWVDVDKAFDMFDLWSKVQGRAGAGNKTSFKRGINSANVRGVHSGQLKPGDHPLYPDQRTRVIRGIRPTLKYDSDRRKAEAPTLTYINESQSEAAS